MKRAVPVAAIVLAVALSTLTLNAQTLSIYDIQYTADSNDPNSIHNIQYNPDPNDPNSLKNGEEVNCPGGIVIDKWTGGKPKLTLYDPNWPDGWGGIMVKDYNSTGDFDDVNVGDWIAVTDVEVKEFKGTTFLLYKTYLNSDFTILSTDNSLPEPLPVRVADIAAPIEQDPNWKVANYNAERYEAMLIKVVDVNVAGLDYGKEADNYILTSNRHPNDSCWAADYMNDDLVEIYHDLVQLGQRFCGVAGILEQYTAEKDGIYYDYYQLLTTDTNSFTVTQTGDFDDDCDVDFADYALFAVHWDRQDCAAHQWCDGADIDESGWVDMIDLKALTDEWLEGKL